MIGTSGFFELAVAAVISSLGQHSGVVLATVVNVLFDVPVMVTLANLTRHWLDAT